MTKKKISREEAAYRELTWFFQRNGYVRYRNDKRYAKEGYKKYKKGDEVRLVAYSKKELAYIRKLLKAVGFKFGSPFRKHNQYCQPIYGRKTVPIFLNMVEKYMQIKLSNQSGTVTT